MNPEGGSRVESFAQTHLQLFEQMRRAGYAEADLVLVDRAHSYARELFAGSYRGSGKPFLCHLVGTASVLACLAAPAPLVGSALLHAAYQLGDFGAGWLGLSQHKRRQFRARMGPVIDELVGRYTRHEWDAETPTRLLARLARGEEIDREVSLMRLANEIDEHLDLGILYYRDAAERLGRLRRLRGPAIDLARSLGEPRLADALEAVFGNCLSATVADALRTRHAVSFAVVSPSRTTWRLRRALAILRPRD